MQVLAARAVRDIWWFFLIVLVGNGVMVTFNVIRATDDERITSHTLEVLADVNSLTATVYEAQTFARNFLFTGDESFYTDFVAAVEKEQSLVTAIRAKTADNPVQLDNLVEADAAIRVRLEGLKGVIELRRRLNRFDEAQMAPVVSDRRTMDRVRASLRAMATEEERLLLQRRESAHAAINTSVITTVIGSAATVGLLGLLYYLIKREDTIRRQKEEEVREANLVAASARRETADTAALLDTFFLNAPVGLAFFDRDLRLLRINRYLTQYSAEPSDKYLNRTVTDLLPQLPAVTLDDLRHVVESGAAVVDRISGDVRASSVAEGQSWQSDYYPVRSESGDLLGVGVVVRDITQRLRAEQVLKQSEARFRILAETLPQIVWVTRPDGFHEFYNHRWYEFTGESVDATVGMVGWFGHAHPDDRTEVEGVWRRALKSNEPFEAECRLRGIGGEYRWFLCRALPVRDESGRTARWFGTCTDVNDQRRTQEELEERVRERTHELNQVVATLHEEATERERAVEQLRLIGRELARSNGELEQFAYVASHDLQEPLRKIQAFGDRIRRRHLDKLDGQAAEYLERMLASAERMRHLIQDLLAFSRLTTRFTPFQQVDLNQLTNDVLGDLEERIAQTNARIDIGPLPTLEGDPVQLRQLIQNLLANALKFHKPDQAPEIRVRSERLDCLPNTAADGPPAPGYRIEFHDNGIGFDMAYANRIFQVFQRLHGREAYEGTGIGLAVCRKIAERHGGAIAAQSEPGNGATFVVTLPEKQLGSLKTE